MRRWLLFLLIGVNFIRAQQCGGSFGSPIFTEDFGYTPNSWQTIAPALVTPAFTTYNYAFVYPPDDGDYSVVNFTGNSGWGWYNSADHTAEPPGRYGNMLVVNADYTPGEFYRRRVSGLCSGQIYNFSAWILNIHKSGENFIKPNVTMEIRSVSGTVLATIKTNDLPEDPIPQWREFGVPFKSDPISDVVDVVMINNAPGGVGNDLAIDDITFRPCGPSAQIVSSLPAVFTEGVCENSAAIELRADIEAGTFSTPSFIWQKSTDSGLSWQNLTLPTSDLLLTVTGGSYNDGDLFRFAVGQGSNINLSSCRVLSPALRIKVNGYPPAPPERSFKFCKNSPSATLQVDEENVLWYENEIGGIGSPAAPTINTSVGGETTYWISQTRTGCESERGKVVIKIIDNPLPPRVHKFSLCQNSVADALSAEGNLLKWYDTKESNSPLPKAPVPNTSESGVFYYWVTQTVDGCESEKQMVEVEILPAPFSESLNPRSICDGQTIVLDVGEGFRKSVWNETGEDSRYLSVTKPGIYEVELTGLNDCVAIQQVEVVAGETPKISVFAGENFLEISAQGGNPPYYYSIDGNRWQTGNVFQNMAAGIYTVLVKSQTNSCTAAAQTAIVFIPNVITPNDDGKNDRYFIQFIDNFPQAQFTIFNRFGTNVFSSAASGEKVWDGRYQGRQVPTGTYWYKLDLGNGFVKTGWLLVKNR